MSFEKTDRVIELNGRLEAFMQAHIYPREHDYEEFTLNPENLWQQPPWFDELRSQAKEAGFGTCSCRKSTSPGAPASPTLRLPQSLKP